MNVSQALRRISQVRGSLSKWTARRSEAVQWSVKSPPAYPFDECQESLSTLRGELVDLRTRLTIANANNTITLPDGTKISLSEATIALSEIKGEITALTGLRTKAQESWMVDDIVYHDGKHETVEVEHQCAFTTRQRDERVEELTNQFQTTNALLEAANHRVEV